MTVVKVRIRICPLQRDLEDVILHGQEMQFAMRRLRQDLKSAGIACRRQTALTASSSTSRSPWLFGKSTMNITWPNFINRLNRRAQLAATAARVDDSPGWASLTNRPHDYDPARVQEIYANALEAWRKNPIAWRIIAITTDYVVGDRLAIASANRRLNRFIAEFWRHPKNQMDLRLEFNVRRAGPLRRPVRAAFPQPGGRYELHPFCDQRPGPIDPNRR